MLLLVLQVSLKWPIETNLSKIDDVVSDADVEKSEMKTKMLNDLVENLRNII